MKAFEEVVCLKDVQNFKAGETYPTIMKDFKKYDIVNLDVGESMECDFEHKCSGEISNDHFKFIK